MDGDPIEREIDVYITQQIASHLRLLQFNLRQKHLPYDQHATNIEAKVQTNDARHKLQLNIEIEAHTANFDRNKAHEIVDLTLPLGVENPKHAVFENGYVKDTILSSQNTQLDTNYAVGIYVDGELHLTPLSVIQQMKPDFAYLNVPLTNQINAARAKGDLGDDDLDNDDDMDADVPEAVSVRMQTQSETDARVKRQAQAEQASWVDLEVYASNTQESEQIMDKLFTTDKTNVLEFKTSQYDYLKSLSTIVSSEPSTSSVRK